jgi:hypothetical protein
MDRQISWFLSSNPALGAQNVSRTGSYFEVFLQEPFTLPSNATNVTCELQSAVVWNSGVNVAENVNDKFYYSTTPIGGGPEVDQVVTIPPGNYDLHFLAEAIGFQMVSVVGAPIPIGSLTFPLRGGYCLTLLLIRPGTHYISRVRYGQPQDISPLLGFLPGNLVWSIPVVVGNEQAFQSDLAPPAKDGTRDWLIQSSLVNRGIRVNSRFQNVLATINFSQTPPGSQLLYAPPQPKPVPTDLTGLTINFVASYITDALTGLPVDTTGDYWSYIAVIKYQVPVVVPEVVATQAGAGSKKRKYFLMQ